MELVDDRALENSAIVANCRMNRERNLHGTNGYDRDLRFDPIEFLRGVVAEYGQTKWLDLCCGTGKALVEASELLDAEKLSVTIVGVDLVGMFDTYQSDRLELVEESLTEWEPDGKFDLITCVHGLHYIGDKLDLIARSGTWLTPKGRFAGNLDKDNLRLNQKSSTKIIDGLRQAGFVYSSQQKLLRCDGYLDVRFPYRYLGADDKAGPNYTGQAAVNSHYA